MHDKEAATSKRPVYRNFIRAYCKKSNTVLQVVHSLWTELPVSFLRVNSIGETPDAGENYLAQGEQKGPERRLCSTDVSVKLIWHLDQLSVWKKEKMHWVRDCPESTSQIA